MNWKDKHDFATEGADVFAILNRVESGSRFASIQIKTDANFNTNQGRAKLVQSNDRDLDQAFWHDLPEGSITMPNGEGSTLLSTASFTCKYIALHIDGGNVTAGIATFHDKQKSNT